MRRVDHPEADVCAARHRLVEVLGSEDPSSGLWEAVHDGFFAAWFPEVLEMAMEQDPVHRHKDVLTHSIAVTAKTPAVFRLRLAALLHDVGKPATRRFGPDGVTFHHHEAVGARITRARLEALECDRAFVCDVSRLVGLSGRFKGYSDDWTDAAVRRYARDAGPLLGELNLLVRCDCTTRDRRKLAALHDLLDRFEDRLRQLAAADRRARERPPITGDEVMQVLDVAPGPVVGEALARLLDEQRRRGTLERDAAFELLRSWYGGRGVSSPPQGRGS